MKRILKDNWLITIDLDGTFLKDRKPREAVNSWSVEEINFEALRRAEAKGHKVAIVTGRAWRDTKEVYKAAGLKTIVGNYNGGYIHRPYDDKFQSQKIAINRKIIQEIFKRKDIVEGTKNLVVDYLDFSQTIDKEDKDFAARFHHVDKKNILEFKWGEEINYDPFAVTLRLKKDVDANELMASIKREYGDALNLRLWILQPDNEKEKIVYLEFNSNFTTKANAMNMVASYYNIPTSRTIAFGDGLNDIEMLQEAAYGVAMKNASNTVKSYAKDVTDVDNNEGGVGKFLIDFFGL